MSARQAWWAWVVREFDGREGIIMAIIPRIGQAQLIARDREIAETVFGPLAELHRARTGSPVRMIELVERVEDQSDEDQLSPERAYEVFMGTRKVDKDG